MPPAARLGPTPRPAEGSEVSGREMALRPSCYGFGPKKLHIHFRPVRALKTHSPVKYLYVGIKTYV